MHRRLSRVGGWLLLMLVPAWASAAVAAPEDAVSRVEAYLGPLKTLSADFVQVVRNRDGEITDRAAGTLSLSRPDRFRWDYREPYVQTIVADGRQLWLYDADLEQVTVRALEAGPATAFSAWPATGRRRWMPSRGTNPTWFCST